MVRYCRVWHIYEQIALCNSQEKVEWRKALKQSLCAHTHTQICDLFLFLLFCLLKPRAYMHLMQINRMQNEIGGIFDWLHRAYCNAIAIYFGMFFFLVSTCKRNTAAIFNIFPLYVDNFSFCVSVWMCTVGKWMCSSKCSIFLPHCVIQFNKLTIL